MKGIELSYEFFKSVREELETLFPKFRDRVAVGVFGSGSECFGFDDELSKDHDLSSGFTMLLTDSDDSEFGFELGRKYHDLCKSQKVVHSKFSIEKFGVFTIDDYFTRLLGFSSIPTDYRAFLYTPEYAFSEATNGKIFVDNLGVVTDFRNKLKSEYPKDVKLKKLAGHLAMMAQSGQYNYYRMLQRNDKGTALCLSEFVNHTIATLYLLEDRFCPYYKWQFKGLEEGSFGYLLDDLYYLLNAENNDKKGDIIEEISRIVIKELKRQEVSDSYSDYLEDHAISVQQHITNRAIRAMHLMDYGR